MKAVKFMNMNLVRRRVLFKPGKKIEIPYDYNHDIMKAIYYYISVIDEKQEKFLHNEGFTADDGHRFKLFNFALRFGNAKFEKDYIEVDENSNLILILSGADEVVNTILRGLLHIKKIKIADFDIPLVDIKKDGFKPFNKVMLYQALSPVVITTMNDNKYTVSLKPYVDKYYINLAKNLKKKYKLVYGEDFNGPLFFDINDVLNMKEKTHRIKGIYKMGYLYDIWIETTIKMHRIIYYLGLGENNSTGAGCMDMLMVGDSE